MGDYRNLPMAVDSPFILAPLAGVSDGVFRYLCRKQGAAFSYTEMVSAKGFFYGSEATDKLLKILPREGPVGVQLFGSEPEMFSFAGNALKDRPNVLFDINMGCPVPKVVKNGEGSALLKNPDLAARCVEALVSSQKKPVSVKFRLGFSERDDEALVRFARALENAGASAISVHGRTRAQFYSGKADWDGIKLVKENVKVPVIGNGDVFSPDDAKAMMEKTGCDAVMIGRASLGNPWIFRECLGGSPPDIREIQDTISEHYELLKEEKGEYTALQEMRKHVSWYTKGLPCSSSFRRSINSTKTDAEFIDNLKLLFDFLNKEENL